MNSTERRAAVRHVGPRCRGATAPRTPPFKTTVEKRVRTLMFWRKESRPRNKYGKKKRHPNSHPLLPKSQLRLP